MIFVMITETMTSSILSILRSLSNLLDKESRPWTNVEISPTPTPDSDLSRHLKGLLENGTPSSTLCYSWITDVM
jgi:hypothetical protein